jgi:thiosulfate/3-mercaptopyruvate sulfurtransferase
MSSHPKRFSNLVLSPTQLANILPSDETVPIDVSWFMPNVPRKPDEEFLIKRIPKARRLDLDLVASSHPLGLKHMMPSPDVFAAACGKVV